MIDALTFSFLPTDMEMNCSSSNPWVLYPSLVVGLLLAVTLAPLVWGKSSVRRKGAWLFVVLGLGFPIYVSFSTIPLQLELWLEFHMNPNIGCVGHRLPLWLMPAEAIALVALASAIRAVSLRVRPRIGGPR